MFGRLIKTRDPSEQAMTVAGPLLEQLLDRVADARGIRIEAAVHALGSLAGHAAQRAALAAVERKNSGYAGLSLIEVRTDDGGRYWFGDALNRPLADGPFSLWHAVVAAAERLGETALPDIDALIAAMAARVGQESFEAERDAIAQHWPAQRALLGESKVEIAEWPMVYGFAFTQLVAVTDGQFAFPDLAGPFIQAAVTSSRLRLFKAG